jgi:hypothetical protein
VTAFAAHFTPAEFARRSDRVPSTVEFDRAARLSHGLELMRGAVNAAVVSSGIAVPPYGEPVVVTSFLRSGNPQSQHFDGTGVDVRLSRKVSQRVIYDVVTKELRESGVTWGQLIFYPFSDWHVHYSLATGSKYKQILIASRNEDEYFTPTPELVASLPTLRAPFPPASIGNAALALALGIGAAAIGASLA